MGSIANATTIENGYLFACENALVKLELFNAGTVRVNTIRANKEFEKFSYVVNGTPIYTPHEYFEESDYILIQTAKIKIRINKNPLRVQFLTLQGQIINQDHPSFGTSWIGSEIASYKSIQPNEIFVGLGEKTGNLNRRGSYYTHWNTDYFAYPTNGDPLYVSTPFFIGIHGGLCYGLFYNNSYNSKMDFGASNDRFTSFSAADGEMDYYFFYDDTISGILSQYTSLTGHMHLPPLWSLGFQQCRYSYYPDKEVLNVARTFREKDIPADVIYLDIHYMDKYKVFTWHPEHFANPDEMIEQLSEIGFHTVLILDPGVKIESGYTIYEEGIEKNLFLKYPDGDLYRGDVWPGKCHFPDFSNPETRLWWGEKYAPLIQSGIEGFWNDMNEPATWGKSIPDMVEFNYEGIGATHRKAHNLYGLLMARSTYEGTKERLMGKRPFVLTRSGFSGIQRYAAVWTGDNIASDEHMFCGVRLVNSLGLAGIPFAGYDVGGFAGEASPELFARWIALGAFSPFFRCHSMINSRDAEPWSFGEEVEEISRNYIKLRYRLLPYIYSTFYEASQSGVPVQRSLVLNYMNDARIYSTDYQNEYLFGSSFLIAPISSTQVLSKIYLPEGFWYDFFTDKAHDGNSEIIIDTPKGSLPVLVKGGSIIPMQSAVAHTGVEGDDTMEIHLYNGVLKNSFTYYEDDGSTFAYEELQYYLREIILDSEIKQLSLKAKSGQYHSRFKSARIYFHGFKMERPIQKNGLALTLRYTDYRFVLPLSNFDPWDKEQDASKMIRDLPYVQIALSDEEIILCWR